MCCLFLALIALCVQRAVGVHKHRTHPAAGQVDSSLSRTKDPDSDVPGERQRARLAGVLPRRRSGRLRVVRLPR